MTACHIRDSIPLLHAPWPLAAYTLWHIIPSLKRIEKQFTKVIKETFIDKMKQPLEQVQCVS